MASFSLTSLEWKERGNHFFALNKFEHAMECYTRAIGLNKEMSVLYSNRALALQKLFNNDAAMNDCKKALELDPTNIKALYLMGLVYCEQNLLMESQECLLKAQKLALDMQKNVGDQIALLMRSVKRKQFENFCAQKGKEENVFEAYLHNLIVEDCNRELNAGNINNETYVQRKQDYLQQLRNVFEQTDEKRKIRDIPDYLCGKISFDLLNDPVVTPSGITYERQAITCHLCSVGQFDPITRKPLTVDQLIPNLSIKEVVQAFRTENRWAEFL